MKERLLLNHIIVLNNLCGPDACVTLLVVKIQSEYWRTLKTFLIYLSLLREGEMPSVEIDEKVLDALRKL